MLHFGLGGVRALSLPTGRRPVECISRIRCTPQRCTMPRGVLAPPSPRRCLKVFSAAPDSKDPIASTYEDESPSDSDFDQRPAESFYSPDAEVGFNAEDAAASSPQRSPRRSFNVNNVKRKPWLSDDGKGVPFDRLPQAALSDLYTRLCENEVEYNDMKHMCKKNALGGRDVKSNLRAKLIFEMKRRLNHPIKSKQSYGTSPKRPSDMSADELSAFYQGIEVVEPADRDEAVRLAYAIMVLEGVLDERDVPLQASDFDKKNTDNLREMCHQRKLSQTGTKGELIRRLMAHDDTEARARRGERAKDAARKELAAASIDVAPRPPNAPLARQLAEAQRLAAQLDDLALPSLRGLAASLDLPVYGTSEVLQERILGVLRRKVVGALAGEGRIMLYAMAAVKKLDPLDVNEELSMRGLGNFSGMETPAVQLASALVADWIHEAMHPAAEDMVDSGAAGADDFGTGTGDDDFAGRFLEEEEGAQGWEAWDNEGRGPAAQAEEFEAATEAAGDGVAAEEGVQVLGKEDPTMDVVLVCSGATAAQRAASLAAARVALPALQSDPVWGTVRPIVLPVPSFDFPAPSGVEDAAPPTDPVEILALSSIINGVAAKVDCRALPGGHWVSVSATPLQDEDASLDTVTAASRADLVMLEGLRPGVAYSFAARMHNAGGEGPEGDAKVAATAARQGVAVQILYEVPSVDDGGEPRYVSLKAHDVFSVRVDELDARLVAGEAAAEGRPMAELVPEGCVVLPLGPPLAVDAPACGAAALATSWNSPEMRRLVASRPSFVAAARSLGYDAVPLLQLSSAELSSFEDASAKLLSWMEAQGLDPWIARVAARAEASGAVLAAGVGRGVTEVLAGAAQLLSQHPQAGCIVLEAVHPGAVYFTCAVIAGESGAPVSLPPTEIDYDDFDEAVFSSELAIRRFFAVRDEGLDPDKVDALLAVERETHRMPPGVFGGPALPSQRLRHSTPPTSLSGSVAQSIRLAAAKLFSELRLIDYAAFSGWVVPEDPLKAAGLEAGAALLKLADGGDLNLVAGAADAAAVAAEAADQRPRGRPFVELQALHDAQQAQQETLVNGISHDDRASAHDVQKSAHAAAKEEPQVALTNSVVSREAGEGAVPSTVRYGTFLGLELNDRTREEIFADSASFEYAPVPEGPPAVQPPTSLPDLAAKSAAELCCIAGQRIAFSQLELTPDFGDRLGVLAQAVAAAGMDPALLSRQLVSRAAVRAGLPPLPPLEAAQLPPIDAAEAERLRIAPDEDPMEEDAATAAAAELDFTFADMNFALAKWQEERAQRPALEDLEGANGAKEAAESHGAIAEAGDGGGAAAEATAAEAGLSPFSALSGPENDADGWLIDNGEAVLDPLDRTADGAAFGASYDDDNLLLGGGGIGGSYDSSGSDAEELADEEEQDPDAVLMAEYPGLHPTRQRVWILCGGEVGARRDESMQAAVEAVAALQFERDLLVETFLLDPIDAGLDEGERRATLLQRRVDLVKMGATEEEFLEGFPEYHLTRIKTMAPPDPSYLAWRGVYRLTETAVLSTNAPNMKESMQEVARGASTPWLARKPNDELHLRDQLMASVHGELELAGVATGGPGPWGGSLERATHPEYSFLKDWMNEAAQQCVVVLLLLPDQPSAQGAMQRELELRGIPHTGLPSVVAQQCADRAEVLRTLAEAAAFGGFAAAPPFHSISLPELAATCQSEDAADALFSRVLGWWEQKALVIRPREVRGASLGAATVTCGRDIQIYVNAIANWDATLPAAALAAGTGPDVVMPLPPPVQFILEPLSRAVPLQLRLGTTAADGDANHSPTAAPPPAGHTAGMEEDALARKLTWPTADAFMQVTACLLGGAGTMQCLGFATAVAVTQGEGEEAREVGSFDLTPVPGTFLHPAVAAQAEQYLFGVAQCLGLGGAVEITALLNVETAEVIVQDVNPHPDLSPTGLLARQAARQRPLPMSYTRVLRDLLKVGMSRGEEDNGGGMESDVMGELYSLGTFPGEEGDEEEASAAGGAAGGGLDGGREGGSSGGAQKPEEMYWGDPYLTIDPNQIVGGPGREQVMSSQQQQQQQGYEEEQAVGGEDGSGGGDGFYDEEEDKGYTDDDDATW